MAKSFARHTRTLLAGLLTVATLGLTACSATPSSSGDATVATMPQETSDRIQAAVESALQLSGSTQAVVGVWAPWAGDYVQGFSTEGDAPAASAQFRAAQSGQPGLCAVLLSLVEEGTLTLDRKVVKDLPRQMGIGDATYGELCTQRSGLADFKADLAPVFVDNPTRNWAARELLAEGTVRSPLTAPGEDFHYADTNALLLGRALSVLTNTDLSVLMKQHLFSPANMNDSFVQPEHTTTLGNNALPGTAYPRARGELQCEAANPVPEVSATMLGAAGNTVSTVGDLKDMLTAYTGGDLNLGEGQDTVLTALPTANPKRDAEGAVTEEAAEGGNKWAFGLLNHGPLVGRSGAITGTISAAFTDPESGYTVALALNNSSAGSNFAQLLAFEISAVVAETLPGGLAEMPASSEESADAVRKAAVCN